jgi:hypothetical protein
MIRAFAAGASMALCALSAEAASTDALAVGHPALAAVALADAAVSCTGLMIAPDRVLTAPSCLLKAGSLRQNEVSILPGLNMSDKAGPGAVKPSPREFVASIAVVGEVGFLQTGILEGRPPPTDFVTLQTPEAPMTVGDPVQVLHYGGEQGGAQMLTDCALEEGLRLSCALPSQALGAPVLRDGLPVGIVSSIAPGQDTVVVDLPQADMAPRHISELPAKPFSGVDVLNLCDQDVHQGLVWLDRDGETWRDLAKRVPAQSRLLLPVMTIGDSVFSYARSDDGQHVWKGEDLTTPLKGVEVDMVQVPTPQPTGDLTLVYECG